VLKGLLLANMERGVSATGIAYQDGTSIRVKKSEGPADAFLKSLGDRLPVIAQSPRGLIHARYTTKGSEKQNENNHPVVGFQWAVVHNGTILNDDDLWAYYTKRDRVSRFAEVDTSAIPLVLGRGKTLEDSIQNLSLLSGSLTVAAWNSKNIEQIILGRFGYNELFLFYDQSSDIMYWSSASSAAYIMHGQVFGRHKFLSFSRLADEHVLVLRPGGFDQTRVFKVTRRPFLLPRQPFTSATFGKPMASMPALTSTAAPVAATAVRADSGRICVTIPVLPNQRAFTIEWGRIDPVAAKPPPMYQHFSRSWMSLGSDNASGTLTGLDHTVFTGYGRWVWSTTGKVTSRAFHAYKRTKSWWFSAFKTKFDLPLSSRDDGSTEQDGVLAWEHYDLNVQLLDNSTRRFLGFMCPLCGIWTSSVTTQHNKARCEYCNVRHRLYTLEPTTGG
jgi:predicted glutamine amidotransferase